MQIEKKGTGPWPTVSVDGTTVSITACGETRAYDCNALQGDAQVVLDIVRTADGALAEGVANGVEYVANLIIPASRYENVPLPMTLEEPVLPEGVDPASISPAPTTETVRKELAATDMEAIRLILWTITENSTQEG